MSTSPRRHASNRQRRFTHAILIVYWYWKCNDRNREIRNWLSSWVISSLRRLVDGGSWRSVKYTEEFLVLAVDWKWWLHQFLFAFIWYFFLLFFTPIHLFFTFLVKLVLFYQLMWNFLPLISGALCILSKVRWNEH